MSAQHTPGPWLVKSWSGDDAIVRYFAARDPRNGGPLEWMKGDDGKICRFKTLRECRAAIAKATT